MEKVDVVAALGQSKLLLPARITGALAANDRLKFALTALQPRLPMPRMALLRYPTCVATMRRPISTRRGSLEMQATAWLEGGTLHRADLARLGKLLGEDIRLMARPLEGSADAVHKAQIARVDHWCDWLDQLNAGVLDDAQMLALTGGKRGESDTFHILVMDLHKSLNRLAVDMSDDTVDGAHVWQLDADDRPRVAAFMRGLNRTRRLKFDHPGLDTAATRDGARLLIQNDIGTNDVHVLVMQMEGFSITLTYSDLHERRFAFFQGLFGDWGAMVGNRRAARQPV